MAAINHAAEDTLPIDDSFTTGSSGIAQEIKLPQNGRCKISLYPVTNAAEFSFTGTDGQTLSGRPIPANTWSEITNGWPRAPRGQPSIFVTSSTGSTVIHYLIEGV